MEFVSEVIGGHNVQQQDVLGFGVQTRDSELHLRKHLPVMRKQIFIFTVSSTNHFLFVLLLFEKAISFIALAPSRLGS